jgi:hypothetical protein
MIILSDRAGFIFTCSYSVHKCIVYCVMSLQLCAEIYGVSIRQDFAVAKACNACSALTAECGAVSCMLLRRIGCLVLSTIQ